MRIGIPRETAPLERRVALVPETAGRLSKAGLEVVVEPGAGQAAGFPDASYREAGAVIAARPEEAWEADAVLKVQRPSLEELDRMRQGAVLVAAIPLATAPEWYERAARRGITAFSMDRIPRITRAQSMDSLSSQSNIAGYKAVLLAASALGKVFPLLMTAAGTLAPARVLVLGAGVAGLQAIATARRLGAVVTGYDVRPAVKEQVESLGAKFLQVDLSGEEAQDKGGYAKEISEESKRRQAEMLRKALAETDIAITTALIPGKPAPRLITAEMVKGMRPGSVIVDLASEAGGNCELTRPGEEAVSDGVTILGPLNLPATVPIHASQMYSRNISTFLQALLKDGRIAPDLADEIQAATCVTHAGETRIKP